MAFYMVLEDFAGDLGGPQNTQIVGAGTLLDDAVYNIPVLLANGCPLVLFNPATMGAAKTAFDKMSGGVAQINPDGNLLALLLAFGAFGTSIAATFEWRLNGQLVFFPPQPSSFTGLSTTSAIDYPLLAGVGPFDGQRTVLAIATLAFIRLELRVPPGSPGGDVKVEMYRIRAGLVTSLGVFTLTASAPNTFTSMTGVPAPTDLAIGDILFASLVGPVPTVAEDLTVSAQVVPV